MRTAAFEYIKGAAKTKIPWYRPRGELLNIWKDEFLKISGVDKYKFWVCGGILEDWETWDTDILVTGKVTSYQELENIMVSATQLGLNYRQLIDINWNNSFEKYLAKGGCERRSICCERYYETGRCDASTCILAKTTVTIAIATETIKNGKVTSKVVTSPQPARLRQSLWKLKIKYPSEKQMKRLREGDIYEGTPVLITPDLDFRTIINEEQKENK